MSFKDSVLDAAVTPNHLGKLFIVVLVGVFALGVWITNAERDTAELRAIQTENAKQIATNTAEFVSLTDQLTELTSQVKLDRELAAERREAAQRDRDRIQQSIDSIIEMITQ